MKDFEYEVASDEGIVDDWRERWVKAATFIVDQSYSVRETNRGIRYVIDSFSIKNAAQLASITPG